LTAFGEYIKAEVLADSLDVKDLTPSSEPFELDEGIAVHIAVEKSV
jgi:hypothetical protein